MGLGLSPFYGSIVIIIFRRKTMELVKDDIRLRTAGLDDTRILNKWWNDGRVMEHAGFPEGLGEGLDQTLEKIRASNILNRLCIIEIGGRPVGELSYRVVDDLAYLDWKICREDYLGRGYEARILNLALAYIFGNTDLNAIGKINQVILDTLIENEEAQAIYEDELGASQVDIVEGSTLDQLGNPRTLVKYEINKGDFTGRTSRQIKKTS